MTGLAASHSEPAAIPAKPRKERQPSKRMQQALIHLATKGVNQREAAKLSGISEFHLSRELKKPQIQAFIARRRSEIIQIGSLKAATRAVELIDADSEHVAAKVTLAILSHTGDVKGDSSQVAVNVGVSVGYVIDLSGSTANPSATTIDARVTRDGE
jgi:hypothetical protein